MNFTAAKKLSLPPKIGENFVKMYNVYLNNIYYIPVYINVLADVTGCRRMSMKI